MNRAQKRHEKKLARKAAKKGQLTKSTNRMAPEKMLSIDQQTLTIEQAINTAVQHHTSGSLAQAKAIYQKILDIEPQQPVALHLIGVVAYQSGENTKAVELINRALSVAPDYADAHNNLGNAYRAMKKPNEAIESFQKAIVINPNYADAYNNLGNTFKELGNFDAAVTSYKKSLAIKPDSAEAYNNLGETYKDQENLDEAEINLSKALSLMPDFAEAHNNLGNVFKERGQPEKAIESYHQALSIKPNYVKAQNNLGNAFKELGQLDDAISGFRKAISIDPNYAEGYSNLLYSQNYQTGVTLETLAIAHAEWEGHFGVPLQAKWTDHENTPDENRPLRIGFVSPDLGRHPVGFFIANLLEFKQKNDVKFMCYSDRKPDDLTERLRNLSDAWMDCRGISDEALTHRIRSDKIDILIDLAGHTANNRLLVFARKPAPLQITWAGYVGSTGLASMDYLFADGLHVPKEFEPHYLEKIIRLPDGYICYEPPTYAPAVGSLPFERNGFITFGSFHNPAKLNNLVLSTWAEVLKAAPNSQLILKYRSMDSEGNRNRIIEQFSQQGIEETRLTFEGMSPHPELLARYNDVDIGLDTFPYSGGLTTCEALWMGVPVITKPDETFASRHSLSHLTNVGATELVASDLSDYISKAVELANDVSRLSALRSGLRKQTAESGLCNGEKFAKDFTTAMRLVWQEWCALQNSQAGDKRRT
jgi:protein O-GlcNAc transferase